MSGYSLTLDKSSSDRFTLKSKSSRSSSDDSGWCSPTADGSQGQKGLVKLLIGRSGSQQTLTCDKRKLSLSSGYFAQRIVRDMDSELPEWVVLHDADVSALEVIIEFISAGTFSSSLPIDMTLRVLQAAKQFEMDEVANQFRNQIKNNVKGVDAGVEVLGIGNRLGDPELRRVALDYLIPRFSALIKSNAFMSLSQAGICALLKDNRIVVKSESLLFDVISKWAKSECKKSHMDSTNFQHFRAVLGDICNLIRFPTMKPDYFHATVVPTGLLTKQDCELLEHYWKLLETDSVAAAAMSLPFEKLQRTGKRYSATFFPRKASNKIWRIPVGQWMTIKLRSEYSIKVHSLLLHGGGERKGPIPVKTVLLVKAGTDRKSKYRTENTQDAVVRLTYDRPGSSRLELETPIIISAGRKYKFSVFFKETLQDYAEGCLQGTEWSTVTANSGQEKFKLLAKKVKGGDFMFHSLSFSLVPSYNAEKDMFFMHKEEVGHPKGGKEPVKCGIV